jgi:predicted NUDIX family NTP pyrophosphohydrolase
VPRLARIGKLRGVPKRSAGLLLYRTSPDLQVLLVHPGGPFFARKDDGVWSVPKGEYEPDEDPLAAARREFAEELGTAPPDGEPIDLGEITQRAGKIVTAWALEGDLDVAAVVSNTFEME